MELLVLCGAKAHQDMSTCGLPAVTRIRSSKLRYSSHAPVLNSLATLEIEELRIPTWRLRDMSFKAVNTGNKPGVRCTSCCIQTGSWSKPASIAPSSVRKKRKGKERGATWPVAES